MFARGILSFQPAQLPASPEIPLTLLFPLHTKSRLVSLFFPLLTQKQGGGYPRKNVGAPTFLIFPLIFRIFSRPRRLQEQKARLLRRALRRARGLA